MKNVVIVAALVGAVAGTLASLGAHRIVPPRIVVVHAPPGATDKHLQRQATRAWGELEQAQVDGLTQALGTIAKRPVTILCRDRSDCGDLALDLENAFESAHWEVKIDAPLFDETVGLGSNDSELASVVGAVTGIRVATVPKLDHHPIFLVIGRKPG